MATPPAPPTSSSQEQNLNVKLSLGDAAQFERMFPKKDPPSPPLLQRIAEWWGKLRKPYQVSFLLLAAVVVCLVVALMTVDQMNQPGVLVRGENAGYRYMLTGTPKIIPQESSILQLTLTNPITVTQTLTNVIALVSLGENSRLPLAPDRTGWVMDFGNLLPGNSVMREMTITLNSGAWVTESARLDLRVKNGENAWQPLGSADIGAYPVARWTQWRTALRALIVALVTGIITLLGPWLLRALGMTLDKEK